MHTGGMDERQGRELFIGVFGALFPREEWPAPALGRILDTLRYRGLEAGATILREGQSCSSAPFVIEGCIRVYKTAESGREITLYRIERGQSCLLSASCGSGIPSFPATVVAETECMAAFMPSETVKRLLAEGPAFREFVFSQYSRRMAEVIELVEEVAFRRVDERLRQWLAESAGAGGGKVAATHQGLADHLGTSREVVSRILKDWEQRGLLEISRGWITLRPGFGREPA